MFSGVCLCNDVGIMLLLKHYSLRVSLQDTLFAVVQSNEIQSVVLGSSFAFCLLNSLTFPTEVLSSGYF